MSRIKGEHLSPSSGQVPGRVRDEPEPTACMAQPVDGVMQGGQMLGHMSGHFRPSWPTFPLGLITWQSSIMLQRRVQLH